MVTHLDDVAARCCRLVQITRLESVDSSLEVRLRLSALDVTGHLPLMR